MAVIADRCPGIQVTVVERNAERIAGTLPVRTAAVFQEILGSADRAHPALPVSVSLLSRHGNTLRPEAITHSAIRCITHGHQQGQVTLRKELLAHLGIQPGQRVDVEVLPGGRLELHAERPPATSMALSARWQGVAPAGRA